jgi:hypothetical protein
LLKNNGMVQGAHHCFEYLPYTAVVFMRYNGKTPIYMVAGVVGGPWGSSIALGKAHKQHGGDCHYCKKPIEKGTATIDHVESRSVGGSNSLANLVLSHDACNKSKGKLPIESYNPEAGKEWLSALLKQVEDRLQRLK